MASNINVERVSIDLS